MKGYSIFIIEGLFDDFSSLDSNFRKTSGILLIRRKNSLILLLWPNPNRNSSFHSYTPTLLLHLDEIESDSNISYFLSTLAKKKNLEWKVISFFYESAFMLFRTVQFLCLWDHFLTRGNEKNSRMDFYLCLDRG